MHTAANRLTQIALVFLALCAGSPMASATEQDSRTDTEHRTYLVRFPEPGVTGFLGDLRQTPRTVPSSETPLNVKSAATKAYVAHLRTQQERHLDEISARLGRRPLVTHDYVFSRSGVALQLDAFEAEWVEALIGEGSVEADVELEPSTYRGPSFIGADRVWALPIAPPGTGAGRGTVIGLLDSGIGADHVSFADDPDCGFNSVFPKVRSARDCSSSAAGVCNGSDPEEQLRHGTETASIAAGNVVTVADDPALYVPPPYTQISGVAPCAALRSYNVCAQVGCTVAQVLAGVENILIDDDVDVVVHGFSGGESPWSDVDRAFLDLVAAGILVVAPAGNISAASPQPEGTVQHRAPWLLTVAGSSHDEAVLNGSVTATGPGVPAPATQSVLLVPAVGGPFGAAGNLAIRIDSANPEGCSGAGGFPAGHFDDAVALVPHPGSAAQCSFTEKVLNAEAAGAEFVFVYSDPNGFIFGLDNPSAIPVYFVGTGGGPALRTFIEDNRPDESFVQVLPGARQGKVLSRISRRGPTPAPLSDLTKPDLTAPGTQVLAAFNPGDFSPPFFYSTRDGTSMAAAHVAGSAALVRVLRPSWTAMQVRSALQLSAEAAGTQEDRATPWTPDQIGHGLVRPDLAIEAGLVMDETFANFLAANPSGGSISVRDLNIPSMRNLACTPTCVFTRTFTGTIPGGQNWLVSYEGDPDINVQVSPSSFSVAEGADQEVTFTLSPNGAQPDTLFGAIVLTPNGVPTRSVPPFPVLRLTVAIAGTGPDADYVFANGFE